MNAGQAATETALEKAGYALKRTSWKALGHVPGTPGLPLLGQTLDFLRNQETHECTQLKRFGPVYRQYTFGACSVVFLSADAAKPLLQNKDGIFSSRLGWSNLVGDIFNGGLMLMDFEEHRFHRRMLGETFKRPALIAYLALMNPVIRSLVRSWGDLPAFRFYPTVKALTLSLAARVFLGMELGQEMDQVNNAFVTMLKAPFSIIPWALPGTRRWRGRRARARLAAVLEDMLERKKAAPTGELLSRLSMATDETGTMLTKREIVDHMVFMMVAAHDTTTSALTYSAFELAANPEWQERARAECLGLGVEEVGFEDLARMPVVEGCFKEVLRLHPPVFAIPRRALADCEIAGYAIPAGTDLWVSVARIHRDPTLWTNPDAFDPDRFSEQRAEHRRDPFGFIPFGGGPHTCLGMHFGLLQAKAILYQILTRYRLRLHPNYRPRHQVVPLPKPMDDLPLILEPLK